MLILVKSRENVKVQYSRTNTKPNLWWYINDISWFHGKSKQDLTIYFPRTKKNIFFVTYWGDISPSFPPRILAPRCTQRHILAKRETHSGRKKQSFCRNYSYQTASKILMRMDSLGLSSVVFELKIPNGPNLSEARTV